MKTEWGRIVIKELRLPTMTNIFNIENIKKFMIYVSLNRSKPRNICFGTAWLLEVHLFHQQQVADHNIHSDNSRFLKILKFLFLSHLAYSPYVEIYLSRIIIGNDCWKILLDSPDVSKKENICSKIIQYPKWCTSNQKMFQIIYFS